MAQDLNLCQFIGRLGKDIEIRYLPDGKAVANGSMAVNGYKDGQVEWVRFSAFGKLAEVMGEYLSKGSQIYLSGRMQTRSFEKDGITRYSTEIVASTVQFLGGKSDRPQHDSGQSQGGYTGAPKPPMADNQDDDIPF